jgi:hypothetical protein
MAVQVYISVIPTLLDGPKIVIVLLLLAQLASTAYFCYLPFKYLKGVAPMEDGRLMADQEELGLKVLSENTDPTSLNEQSRAADYDTMEFVQLSGPGAACPV